MEGVEYSPRSSPPGYFIIEGADPSWGPPPTVRISFSVPDGDYLSARAISWPCSKSNRFIRSPIAGRLIGTYGLALPAIGFGRLSRLRLESGVRPQFFSMNLRIEA